MELGNAIFFTFTSQKNYLMEGGGRSTDKEDYVASSGD